MKMENPLICKLVFFKKAVAEASNKMVVFLWQLINILVNFFLFVTSQYHHLKSLIKCIRCSICKLMKMENPMICKLVFFKKAVTETSNKMAVSFLINFRNDTTMNFSM